MTVSGVSVGSEQHKISLYAVLFLSDPDTSVRCVVDLIQAFGQFSGHKIMTFLNQLHCLWEMNKSALKMTFHLDALMPVLFIWLLITPTFSQKFKADFTSVLEKVCDDLNKWMALHLSRPERIPFIKINILPQLSITNATNPTV